MEEKPGKALFKGDFLFYPFLLPQCPNKFVQISNSDPTEYSRKSKGHRAVDLK